MSDTKRDKVYEQSVLDLRVLTLFGVPFTDKDFKTAPIVRPDIWNNNPRFSIISNNPAEAGKEGRWGKPLSKERFQIGLSPLVMFVLLNDIKKLATGKLKINRRALRTKGYREGKSKANGDKLEITSTIAYGRNEKGQIYLQFKWYNRDACEVVFKPDFFHEHSDIGEMENPIGDQDFADKLAYEWADLLHQQFKRVLFHKFEQTNGYIPKNKGQDVPAKTEEKTLPVLLNDQAKLDEATSNEELPEW